MLLITIALFLPSCQKETNKSRLFSSIPVSQTGIEFQNTLNETEKFNIVQYLYYYNGGGVAAGDINNDGLIDLYFTANQKANKLYLNQGNFQFKDITEQAQVAGNYGENSWSTGVSMVDINQDGHLDIYVCELGRYKHIQGRNRLYINDGKEVPTFTEKATEYGLDFVGFGQQAAWLDYDNDGDYDVYLLNHSVHSAENYAPSDIRYRRSQLPGDKLMRNDGNKFTDVSKEAGIFGSKIGFGLGVSVGDINKDGCPDIYVTNDFHENDYLYYNNCDGTFSEGIKNSTGHTSTFAMGTDMADLNNDGLLDIMTLDMKPAEETILKSSVGSDPYNIYEYKIKYGYHYQYPRNMLQINQGNIASDSTTQFSEIGQLAGISATDWSWSTLLADFDLDGHKDIFITNGIERRPNDLDYLKFLSNKEIQKNADDLSLALNMPSGKVANYAYRGNENLQFEDVSKEWGLDLVSCSQGAAYADLDNDGDLDLVLNNLNAPASIYRNSATEKGRNFLKISLPKDAALGAKILVKTASKQQVQELYPVRGWQSSSSLEATFGLGTDSIVQEVIVDFGNGDQRIIRQAPINTSLHFTGNEERIEYTPTVNQPILNRLDASTLPFTHKENNYVDFNAEKLLPHKLSTEGPALAVGDLNGDALADLICGDAIWIQDKNGFTKSMELGAQIKSEVIDAAIFDVDKDGDNDIYFALGGSQFINGSPQLQDLLFLNDGKGNFTAGTLPDIKTNASCVIAADLNNDGYQDLFVGSRNVPGSYGSSPTSFILLNDGKGNLRPTNMPDEGKIGMVSDAAFVPETQELAVVGEWMPVRLFSFKNNKISERKIEQYGWWNTIKVTTNKEGKSKLLLGNAGKNIDLSASIKQPVELYVKDFDQNGKTDPILTYFKQNKKYTYASKDELAGQLVALKRKYNDYTSFAQDGFTDIFADFEIEKISPLRVTTFASMICDTKGQCEDLPLPLQYSSIQSFAVADFDKNGHDDILSVGNFYGNTPAIGRSDASFGNLLLNNGSEKYTVENASKSGFAVFGEAREVELLKTPDGKSFIVVLQNNGSAAIFEY